MPVVRHHPLESALGPLTLVSPSRPRIRAISPRPVQHSNRCSSRRSARDLGDHARDRCPRVPFRSRHAMRFPVPAAQMAFSIVVLACTEKAGQDGDWGTAAALSIVGSRSGGRRSVEQIRHYHPRGGAADELRCTSRGRPEHRCSVFACSSFRTASVAAFGRDDGLPIGW